MVWRVLLVLAIAVAVPSLWRASVSAPVPLEILVPAYFYPSEQGLEHWNSLASVAGKAPVTAILNPANGPGSKPDPAYTAVVTNARAAGVKVLGYVHSSWGARPLIEVIRDINRYMTLYAVDGIFVDEMGNDGAEKTVNYYLSIYHYVKGFDKKHRVVANPGVAAPELYLSLPVADSVVTFEAGSGQYQLKQVSGWERNYAKDRFGHLIHGVPSVDIALKYVDLAEQRHAGLIYVTNKRISGNPWDALPTYWTDLVSEVCRRNGGKDC